MVLGVLHGFLSMILKHGLLFVKPNSSISVNLIMGLNLLEDLFAIITILNHNITRITFKDLVNFNRIFYF